MAAQLIEMPLYREASKLDLLSVPDPQDKESLAEAAADHLERYRRAPWKGIDDPERMEHLNQAIEYLKQAQELERQ